MLYKQGIHGTIFTSAKTGYDFKFHDSLWKKSGQQYWVLMLKPFLITHHAIIMFCAIV